MKIQTKYNIEQVLEQIHSGVFSTSTISGLLINIREHTESNSQLRDLCDTVAHGDSRDRGLILERFEYYYLRFKFHLEYTQKNKLLDLNFPLPAYVKQLLLCSLKQVTDKDLRKGKLKLSIQEAKSTLLNKIVLLQDNNKCRTIHEDNDSLQNINSIVQFLLSRIIVKPIFEISIIFRNLKSVLKQHNIRHEPNLFNTQINNITLCLLVILHNTIHKLKTDQSYQVYTSIQTSIENNDLENPPLNLAGSIEIKGHKFEFPILITNLLMLNYCDDQIIKLCSKGMPNNRFVYFKGVQNQPDLIINDKFKLSRYV